MRHHPDDTSAKPLSEFEKCFPQPTGANGYEEIVRAGELIESVAASYPPRDGFTLTRRRAYLAQRECQKALMLVRTAVAKPFVLPQRDTFSFDLNFPYSLARSVSRLLSIDAVVHLADGRHDLALRTVEDSLRIAAPMKSATLLALLVGAVMDIIALTAFVRLRELWTPRDCQRIQELVAQQLAQPDPAPLALESERRAVLNLLDKWRTDTKGFTRDTTTLHGVPTDEPETREQRQAREYGQTLQNDDAVRDQVLRELSDMIQEYYDQASALLRTPNRRMQLPFETPDARYHPITLMLSNGMFLGAHSTVQRGVENRLTMQLIWLHAAIRRYRWEHDRLPTVLEDLAARPAFLRDPYTSESLQYTVDKDTTTYRLWSVGALSVGDNGKESREPYMYPHESLVSG